MIVFSVDYDGHKRATAHVMDNLKVTYHPKREDGEEFVVIDHYDLERKEWIQVFIQGAALDQFLEKTGVIAALRFKS